MLGPQPDQLEQVANAGLQLIAAGHPMHHQRLRHDVQDSHAWIKRRERILEDDLQLSTIGLERSPREQGEIDHLPAVAEQDLSAGWLARAQDESTGGRLA